LAKLCSKEKSLYRTALFISQPIGCLLCQTLFEREEYFAWFSKTIEKIPIGILSTKATTKPSSSFFFHFQNQIIENLVSKPREKQQNFIAGGLFEYFSTNHF